MSEEILEYHLLRPKQLVERNKCRWRTWPWHPERTANTMGSARWG
jgi:hypothetical protein